MGKRPPSPLWRPGPYRPGQRIDFFPSIEDMNKVFFPAQIYMRGQWELIGNTLLQYKDRILAMQEVVNEWKKHIDSFIVNYAGPKTAYLVFKNYWRYYRLGIGLQERLLVEQILYDMGYPWNRLVTGFQPVGYRSDL